MMPHGLPLLVDLFGEHQYHAVNARDVFMLTPKYAPSPVCPLCEKHVGVENMLLHLAALHGTRDLQRMIGQGPQATVTCICGEAFEGRPWEALDDICRHMLALRNLGEGDSHRLIDLMGGRIACHANVVQNNGTCG